VAQTRCVNTAAMRWVMQATKAPAQRQRVNRTIAAMHVRATTFARHAMVGRQSNQFKMPRPDAYAARSREHDQPGNRWLAVIRNPGKGAPKMAARAPSPPGTLSAQAVPRPCCTRRKAL